MPREKTRMPYPLSFEESPLPTSSVLKSLVVKETCLTCYNLDFPNVFDLGTYPPSLPSHLLTFHVTNFQQTQQTPRIFTPCFWLIHKGGDGVIPIG